MLSEAKASALELTQRLEVVQRAGSVAWQLMAAHWNLAWNLLRNHMINNQWRSINVKIVNTLFSNKFTFYFTLFILKIFYNQVL